MNMKARSVIRLFSIGLIVMVFMTSCLDFLLYDEGLTHVRVYNASNDSIYFCLRLVTEDGVPPTKDLQSYPFAKLAPKSSEKAVMNSTDLKKQGYNFLIFEQSTIEKYSLDEIREQNIYDFFAVYHYSDLEKMQFTIEYTGK